MSDQTYPSSSQNQHPKPQILTSNCTTYQAISLCRQEVCTTLFRKHLFYATWNIMYEWIIDETNESLPQSVDGGLVAYAHVDNNPLLLASRIGSNYTNALWIKIGQPEADTLFGFWRCPPGSALSIPDVSSAIAKGNRRYSFFLFFNNWPEASCILF